MGTLSTTEQTIEALINGSVSGVIAAAFTTPLDVLKTRSQIGATSSPVVQVESGCVNATSAAMSNNEGALCVHHHKCVSMGPTKPSSTIQIAISIFEKEGISGF